MYNSLINDRKKKFRNIIYLTRRKFSWRREEKRREEKRREEKHNTTFLTNLLSFKLFIILLSLTLLFSISCSNKDKTGGDEKTEEKTFAYYAGTWWGIDPTIGDKEARLITINTDGSMIMHNQQGSAGDITVASTSITKNSDTSYTAIISQEGADIEVNLQLNFTFSSDTQGKFDMIVEQDGVSMDVGSIDITKR